VPRSLWLAVVLVTTGALAQPSVLDDDFEGRADVFDPARWSYEYTAEGVLSLSAAAAHRGDAGFRVTDATGAGSTARVNSKLDRVFDAGEVERSYVRFWLRSSSRAPNFVTILQVGKGGTGVNARQQDLVLERDTLEVNGFGANGLKQYDGQLTLDGGWHLVEFMWEGVGTDAGSRELYLDGVLGTRSEGLDFVWSQRQRELTLGETYSLESFQGVFDVDDLRLSELPPASRLSLADADASVSVGLCEALTLVLLDSRGSQVTSGAPTSMVVELDLVGVPGTVHGDPLCSTASSLQVAKGEAGPWRIGVRVFDGGTGALLIRPDDLLDQRAPLLAVMAPGPPDAGGADGGTAGAGAPDGGPVDGGTSRYGVGCGCVDAPAVTSELLLALVLLRLQPKRRIAVTS